MSNASPLPRQPLPAKVGILLFPDVEVLDFAGPYEVFSVAARIAPTKAGTGVAPFDVMTIGQQNAPIVARHGLRVMPDHDFDNAPPLDILIVPGGVVTAALEDPTILDWIRRTAGRARVTASVCTGAFLLARLGMLDGLSATTHWEDLDDLRTQFPGVTVVEGPPYIDHGAIMTSAGISAGIGMSLHLVSRLVSPDLARLTARQMQYDWNPE
ncbi:DJ-1/PfpI family protein [Sphingomonas sp.]|uniref:DJ-1/PfpI family protein n=1 Tax=Sphingomonas sp. TaxID=28214 RepID=UPI0031D30463